MSGPEGMTGSGVARGRTVLGETAIELRSVNGRGLAIKTRSPVECHGYEAAFEARLRERIQRGSVLVAVDVEAPPEAGLPDIDEALLEALVARMRTLADRLGLVAPTLTELLQMPGVLRSSSARTRTSRTLPDDLAALFDAALDDLLVHRRAEGAATADDMRGHLDALEAASARVQARLPRLVDEHRARILQRVNEYLADRAPQLDPADVVREVALFADRADVGEELQRLAAHVARGRDLLTRDEPVGRAFEFLVQELLREVNTLGSKVPDVEVAHTVLEMKSLVEKLKEQAANLQ